MKDYESIIKKQGKNPNLYLPVINKLLKSKVPLSISELSKILKISYGATKPRLHKLVKWRILTRMKRGYYCFPEISKKYSKISKPRGQLFFIKGCIRVMPQSNGVWVHIYNSKFGERNHGNYCSIESFKGDTCILRKSNEFIGNKFHFLLSKSLGVSISRKEIPHEILKKISTKTIPIRIGIYSNEWDISIKELFSTESEEDGELAEELNKIGIVGKPSKFENLKSDIILNYKNKKIPIEVTTIKPSDISKRPQNRMSSIKASQILMRFYYSIKWNYLHNLSTILVIHKSWEKENWIKQEQIFLKKFNCNLIFTDFKNNWAHKSALEIKRLIEPSLFNKTTRLRSS